MKNICLTGFKVSKLLTDRLTAIGVSTEYGLNDDTELMVVGETPTLSTLTRAIHTGVPMITAEQFEDTTLPALEREHGKTIVVIGGHFDLGVRIHEAAIQGAADAFKAFGEACQPVSEIEKVAKGIFNLFRNTENDNDDVIKYSGWDTQPEFRRDFFRHAAKQYLSDVTAKPSDKKLYDQLADAIKSERHYMSVLKEIGRIFGKNVGVDIGVDDLAWFIGDEVNVNIPHHFNSIHKPNGDTVTKLNTYLSKSKYATGNVGQCVADVAIENLEAYRELCNDLVTSLGLTYTNESYTDGDLIKMVGDLYRKVESVTPCGYIKLGVKSDDLVYFIKQHPELHDLITHLHDFKEAVEMREMIARNVNKGKYGENCYWVRQLNTVNKLIDLTK
ncbi:BRCT domain protein [Vibrio phage 1.072.O._10N.286.48.A12]|nr:BRCT domain protein [Vibrio phage 1.004.O._10N.261.54.A2]AUR83584.1 BRCT domain protein [Vibrio phage 1.037.O._10N.261.52.F7]AUR84469.1 BRCT domain protein [Vibrio phage 1.056.O._10N.261.48.C11]AUR84986.1 BRCT domain protein [Vibrio phage 1.066.O._10N.286.46.E8]AUR85117.1 BRCT domain protein [Vibrio phage 1.068.O._10N.261.51.F8]AUR85342.1 BRCT domain protein [Vibrio phage 1.072.O._10N.286.48.A12]